MIISKQKSLAKYLFFLSLLVITSCYENVEGCLDITAVNYNAAADVDCEDCCSFPQLQLRINSSVDSLGFSRETKYVRDETDTLIFHDIYLLLSEFILQGEDQSYRVTDNFSFDGVNVVTDDLLFEDFTSSTSSIGTIIVNDSLLTASFQVGLNEAVDDKDNDFSEYAVIEELIDSMYFNSTDNLVFFRLDYSHITGIDTIQQQVLVSGQDQVFSETFSVEQDINYGENIVITLDLDVLNLFSGIDFENQSLEDIELAIANNLQSNLFK